MKTTFTHIQNNATVWGLTYGCFFELLPCSSSECAQIIHP